MFRLQRLRGELFALMTISVTAVVATIISNTPIDGGSGVYLISVAVPEIFGSPTGTIYLLGLAMAAIAVGSSYAVAHSRLGLGLFAIHDDEDVAEVKGVPTFHLQARARSRCRRASPARSARVYSIYVSYVTVGETFEITVTMYPVVMTILGGARNWAGPALGAALVTIGALWPGERPAGLYRPRRDRGRAGAGDPAAAARRADQHHRRSGAAMAAPASSWRRAWRRRSALPAPAVDSGPALECRDVTKTSAAFRL